MPNRMGDDRLEREHFQSLSPAGSFFKPQPCRRPSSILKAVSESRRAGELEMDSKAPLCGSSPYRKAQQHYLELLVSLPQHSGRSGKAERSQPPPRAWMRPTALTMRRPRIFTAVTSSERAAL